MENYLAHHGRLGQKWGKRNGPPYPLDYSKLSSEERALAKEEAIRSGNVKEASANRKYYTDDEINKVINRFNLNARLSEISTDKTPTAFDRLADTGKKMGIVADAVGKGTNLYNNLAKISNSLTGSSLPIIGESKKQESSKKAIIEDFSDGVMTKRTTTTTKADGNRYTKNEMFSGKKTEPAEGSWEHIRNTLKEAKAEEKMSDIENFENGMSTLNKYLLSTDAGNIQIKRK